MHKNSQEPSFDLEVEVRPGTETARKVFETAGDPPSATEMPVVRFRDFPGTTLEAWVRRFAGNHDLLSLNIRRR